MVHATLHYKLLKFARMCVDLIMSTIVESPICKLQIVQSLNIQEPITGVPFLHNK